LLQVPFPATHAQEHKTAKYTLRDPNGLAFLFSLL
jgi:hypothetical protein